MNNFMNKQTSYEKGIKAEQKVLFFLKKNEYEIIGTRIKNKQGEIDILGFKNNAYYIFEVKKRKQFIKESINKKQIQRCLNAFYEYCQQKNIEYEQIYIKAALVSDNEVNFYNAEEILEN